MDKMSYYIGSFFFMSILDLFFFHDLIYSILVGNIKKSKHRYKKAHLIAHQYSFIERMKQSYIREHISLYRKDYEFFMCLKRIYILLMLLYPIVLFIVSKTSAYVLIAAKSGLCISMIIGLYLFFHFGIYRRTRYDR